MKREIEFYLKASTREPTRLVYLQIFFDFMVSKLIINEENISKSFVSPNLFLVLLFMTSTEILRAA